MLTKGLDNVPGTSGNDTIIASVDGADAELQTMSPIDVINGGAGTDTLKIAAATALTTANLANISNVEVIEASGAAGVTLDTSAVAGVTSLNVIKAGGAVAATGGAATDVSVAMKAAGAAVGVNGGNNVKVALTDVAAAADAVTVGAAAQAKGDVTVEMTGKAAAANAGAVTLSAVTVTGGKTISVTQKATSDASAAVTDKTAGGTTITQGLVTATGDASTTEITVKQDAAVTRVQAVDAVAGKAATQEVVFTAAKATDTVLLDFGTGTLLFTAKKDMTAAEVASAFANLAKDALQGNASASLGLYTDAAGGVTDGWTSGAVESVSATQAKVVFSNAAAAPGAITTTVGQNGVGSVASAAASGVTGGTAAVLAVAGKLGVANGAVVLDDSAAHTVKTITVDGYATASTIGATTATTALETLNLSNAAGAATMDVADTAATLALNIEKLGSSVTNKVTGVTAVTDAAVTLTAAPTTLNVKSTGNNYVDLSANATETLNVSGTGVFKADTVALGALKTVTVTETAGLTLDATPAATIESVNTTGTTGTVTVTIAGDKATYTGGAGVDSVTISNPNTAISKAVDLGAGNDRLNLSAANAAMATPTVELKGGEGTDTLVFSTAAAVALSAGATFQDKISGFERLELTATTATGTVSLNNLDAINYVITNGNGGGFDLTLDKMLNDATVELKDVAAAGDDTIIKLTDVTGTTDKVNLVTNAATGTDVGTVTVAGVETIAIEAKDTDATEVAATATTPAIPNVSNNKMTLDADKAGNITVTGDGNLELVLGTNTKEVTLVDGSTMNGKLTLVTLAGDTAATTVKGGNGNDVLTAKGANDVLEGGAGKDTLKVDGAVASAVTLKGGAGIDSFDLSTFKAANAGSAVTITDLEKGETIKFVANAAADFKSGKVTLIEEATFTEYVQEAGTQAGGQYGVAWFQFNGNTFIVQDVDATAGFTDGQDIIVKLTGLVDLSASSFNEDTQGTLLYI